MTERLHLSRAQLASFLKDPQAIKQFEGLFKAADQLIPDVFSEVAISAENARSTAQQALDALQRIADTLDVLSVAPPSALLSTSDNPAPPYTPPPEDRDYGELYASGVAEIIAIPVLGVAYEITAGLTIGESNRILNDSAYYLEVLDHGSYVVAWSISFNTVEAADLIEAGVMLNGAALTKLTANT